MEFSFEEAFWFCGLVAHIFPAGLAWVGHIHSLDDTSKEGFIIVQLLKLLVAVWYEHASQFASQSSSLAYIKASRSARRIAMASISLGNGSCVPPSWKGLHDYIHVLIGHLVRTTWAVGSLDPISAQSNACGQVLQVSPHGHPEALRRMHCLDASNVKLEAVSQACGDERWEGYISSASPRLAI